MNNIDNRIQTFFRDFFSKRRARYIIYPLVYCFVALFIWVISGVGGVPPRLTLPLCIILAGFIFYALLRIFPPQRYWFAYYDDAYELQNLQTAIREQNDLLKQLQENDALDIEAQKTLNNILNTNRDIHDINEKLLAQIREQMPTTSDTSPATTTDTSTDNSTTLSVVI